MAPTPVDDLWLVSGAKALVDMANPNYGQKGKILRHINALQADHVILDLGAGSAFNVLDFFLVARKGILVVVPEPTSIAIWSLIGLGLVGFGIHRARKMK